eukprot:gene11432-biopygen9418
MEEAFAAAKEKLTDMVSDFMYRGEAIPPPSLPSDIINRRQQDNEQFAGFVVTFVGVVIVSTLPSLCDKAGQPPSGTMSMSYLKRHVYELRTSMDPNIVVKLQSLDHDMARIWVENAEGVCVDTHEVSVHEATDERTCPDALSRSFDKRRANDRKAWLQSYDTNDTLDYQASQQMRVCYGDFIDKDLKHFSNYDVLRSVPSVVDGLKVSQRKALFGCFKRCGPSNDNYPEARVAQLAAYVSEHSLFHHGEASMQGTIIAMAQNFVGAGNNLNLLQPIGQFPGRSCLPADFD